LTKFDATFFGVHPKQANVTDPQLRLLLEVTYEALLDSGKQLSATCLTFCLSMHSIGQNIKSHKRPSVRPSVDPSVRPASVDKIVTLFKGRSSPNFEYSYNPYHVEETVFTQFDPKTIRAHARPLIDCHLQLSKFCTNEVFAKQSCFCVDYFNKMAEFVFVTAFNTHVCRTNFRETNETLC